VQPLLPAFTQEFGVSGAQSSLSLSTGGAMADRLGRKPVLVTGIVVAGVGVLATLLHALAGMALGVVMLTVGFFIAHSVASGWGRPHGLADQGPRGVAVPAGVLRRLQRDGFDGRMGLGPPARV
jgi:MFS family permease